MQSELDVLKPLDGFSVLDRHFAGFLARLSERESPELSLAASLVSRWTRDGHTCVDLAAVAGKVLVETGEPAPELDVWCAALTSSGVVGRPGDWTPLILDGSRLYLYRYWAYERELAQALMQRVRPADGVDRERLRSDAAELFPPAPPGRVDWQQAAALTAASRQFCVISGGPGTGKTHTVVRILALLVGQNPDEPPTIGLVAPTGKAATRLEESIRNAKAAMELPAAVRDAIPERTSTIHRLLGVRPGSVHFRHDADNPLPLDVLVVDEASMVDLAMMAKLVRALPAKARLILLGDKDQLASVEAGSVLGDICSGPAGFSAEAAELLRQLGAAVQPAEGAVAPIADAIVLLRESHRFRGEGGIGKLAELVNQGEAEQALSLLEAGSERELGWHPLQSVRELETLLPVRAAANYGHYLAAMREGKPPATVFAEFKRFRVLCAHREGVTGVEGQNRLIENELAAQGLIERRGAWYAGRPLMISQNDYGLHLFNGDIGLVLPDPEAGGALRVFFEGSDGSLRRYHPGRLPTHETVYAMTVHKTQGSEFDQVALVLPDQFSRVLSRNLLYTGITRARSGVELWGAAAVFRQAVEAVARRGSGLAAALWR